jgi:hypothetical protein
MGSMLQIFIQTPEGRSEQTTRIKLAEVYPEHFGFTQCKLKSNGHIYRFCWEEGLERIKTIRLCVSEMVLEMANDII